MVMATAPTSAPDQLLWSLCVTPLPSKVMGCKSPSLISGMPRETDMTPLLNTETLAVGVVFHLSKPGPATVQLKTWSGKTTLTTGCRPDKPAFQLISLPSGSTEDDVVVVEDSGSLGDWDRDPIMGVSEDKAI